jgi:outer membrane immunogenic protein
MLKKIFITTALLITSNITFAAAPYVGLSIGANNTNFHLNETWMGTTLDNVSGTKPNINIFGGYGGLITNTIYLGGEVFFNDTLGTMHVTYPMNTSLEYQTRHSYGFNIIPGFMLSPTTMLYGRVGFVRTNFETSVSNVFDSDNDAVDVSGTQGGLGLQTSLNNHLDLRGEFVYTKYSSFTTYGIESKPTSNQFNIGLVYKFI